eukprot:Skav205232  [mRNA]  locus=scaffold1794:134661:139684:+ [translate_table: standard]
MDPSMSGHGGWGYGPACGLGSTANAGDLSTGFSNGRVSMAGPRHTYSWGGEGGPMTGQGQPMPNSTQVDAAYQFRLRQLSHWWVRPHPIRALSGVHIVHIDAGCRGSPAWWLPVRSFRWSKSARPLREADVKPAKPTVAEQELHGSDLE